jgi:hypothetical protein
MKSTRLLAGLLVGTALLLAPIAHAATFSASPASGVASLAVSFSYPYESDNGSWMINVDFGDGSSGTMQAPPAPPCSHGPSGVVSCAVAGPWRVAHTYASAGTYTATLTRGGLPLCATCPTPVLGTVTITVTGSR